MLFNKRNKSAKKINNEKGSALFLALVLILGLVILGTSYVASVHSNSRVSVRTYAEVEAMHIAEAGAELGLLEVNHGGRDFLSTDGWNPLGMGGTRKGTIDIPGGDTIGEFEVTVIKLPTAVGHPKIYEVKSIGYFPNKADSMASKTVKVIAEEEKLFKDAIMGYGGINIGSSARVDSYDSRIGLYNVAGNIGTDANFITNSTAAFAIKIGNLSTVTGGVTIGAGGVHDAVIKLTGSGTYDLTKKKWLNKDMPQLSIPDQTGVFGINKGALTVPMGMTVTINDIEVEYDSITLAKDAKLIINADTDIYVIGNIDLGVQSQIVINPGNNARLWLNGNMNFGNKATIQNPTQDPLRFKIYCTDNVTSFNLGKHQEDLASSIYGFYGNIYAPNADVDVGPDTDFFGSIVGKSVQCTSGLQYHYDIASRYDPDPKGPILGYFVTSWRGYTTP